MFTKNRIRSLLILIGMLTLLAGMCSVAWACPNCKYALEENDPAKNGLAKGFFWSILFMMAMPFALVTGFSGYMYLLVRRARKLNEHEDTGVA